MVARTGSRNYMRKHLLSVALAGLLGVLTSPSATAGTPDDEGVSPVAGTVHRRLPSIGIRDEAAMVLVGTVLIGLAAAVRRAA